ncbi:hypothetical protein NDU88_003352 [Pleurodeles waltl]|uniref:Uncharacterized protein n=1 Tax=Pleurodeles waltl TaxID=8319 RepID=A0AAV7UD29_PLEWA|nr:hypothetical protein NDU88_003352 [Pleurodeles waltl]
MQREPTPNPGPPASGLAAAKETVHGRKKGQRRAPRPGKWTTAPTAARAQNAQDLMANPGPPASPKPRKMATAGKKGHGGPRDLENGPRPPPRPELEMPRKPTA